MTITDLWWDAALPPADPARLVRAVASRFGPHTDAVTCYLDAGDAADLEHLTLDHAVALVKAHLDLGSRRSPGDDLVEVAGAVVRVVTDDVPGGLEAVAAAITASSGAPTRLLSASLTAQRDPDGLLIRLTPGRGAGELWVQAEASEPVGDRAALAARVTSALTMLRAAASDAAALVRASDMAITRLTTRVASDGNIGAAEFLAWLRAGNFTPLGYAEYRIESVAGRPVALVARDTELGILRDEPVGFFAAPRPGDKRVIVVTKDDRPSPGPRLGLCDYVGVRLLDASGRPTAELRFVGFFTERGRGGSMAEVPLLREKIQGLDAGAHLAHVDELPRDELFASSADEIATVLDGVVELHERQQLRLFIRPDAHGRFLACQVYLPRTRCTPEASRCVRRVLLDAVGGEVLVDEASLVGSTVGRLYLVIRPAEPVWDLDIDLAELQQAAECAIETWDERFAKLRHGSPGTVEVGEAYRQAVSPYEAASDVRAVLAGLSDGFVVTQDASPGTGADARLKVFSAQPVLLSTLVRALVGLGADVVDTTHFTWRIGRLPVEVYVVDVRADGVAGTLAGVSDCLQAALIGTAG